MMLAFAFCVGAATVFGGIDAALTYAWSKTHRDGTSSGCFMWRGWPVGSSPRMCWTSVGLMRGGSSMVM